MSHAYSRSPVLYGLCLSAWELVTASRQKIGILISMVTLTLSAGTVIGMAFDRDLNPLQRYNKQSCALQASFGLLGVGAGLQFLLLSFLSYQVIRTRKSKKRVDDYHVNVSANGLSVLALSVGMTLYVTLLTSAADFWYYFLGWDSVVFAILNTLLWFVTEYYHRHAERYNAHRLLDVSSSEEDSS